MWKLASNYQSSLRTLEKGFNNSLFSTIKMASTWCPKVTDYIINFN